MLFFFHDPRCCGATRSSEWPRVRKEHLKAQPTCQVCGGTSLLEAHHIIPFHTQPELELDLTNLITLCEVKKCHFIFGHLWNWKTVNINIVEDAAIWRKKLEKVNLS